MPALIAKYRSVLVADRAEAIASQACSVFVFGMTDNLLDAPTTISPTASSTCCLFAFLLPAISALICWEVR